MNIDKEGGIYNLLAVAANFEKDYTPVKVLNLFVSESISMADPQRGIVLRTEEKIPKPVLPVSLLPCDYATLQSFLESDGSASDITCDPIQKSLFNILSFYGVNVVMGYGEHYSPLTRLMGASIVTKKDNDIFCSEIRFGDLVCMNMINNTPIYVKKKLFDDHGMEFENQRY